MVFELEDFEDDEPEPQDIEKLLLDYGIEAHYVVGFDMIEERGAAMAHAKKEALKFADGFDPRSGERGLRFFGGIGTGKTLFASAIARRIVERTGCSLLFWNVAHLFHCMRLGMKDGAGYPSGDEIVEDCVDVDLLVLDDVGSSRASEWVLENMYAIIDRRYSRNKPIFVTSNMDEAKLESTLGDRTASRLWDMTLSFNIKSENQRRPANGKRPVGSKGR
ncbi:MAG: ATP-binding protein [Deltaproteobacteria bacterium]|nr:ATP-binding protein [Deltaproteobacteria bacterium]